MLLQHACSICISVADVLHHGLWSISALGHTTRDTQIPPGFFNFFLLHLNLLLFTFITFIWRHTAARPPCTCQDLRSLRLCSKCIWALYALCSDWWSAAPGWRRLLHLACTIEAIVHLFCFSWLQGLHSFILFSNLLLLNQRWRNFGSLVETGLAASKMTHSHRSNDCNIVVLGHTADGIAAWCIDEVCREHSPVIVAWVVACHRLEVSLIQDFAVLVLQRRLHQALLQTLLYTSHISSTAAQHTQRNNR
mmetsp:Transcript_77331/g.170817  ORF Transcript_77331/g.170817 Transcript_77331/m.170817 type:complete len:250 (-) Transcript_77331:1998-2747(-)